MTKNWTSCSPGKTDLFIFVPVDSFTCCRNDGYHAGMCACLRASTRDARNFYFRSFPIQLRFTRESVTAVCFNYTVLHIYIYIYRIVYNVSRQVHFLRIYSFFLGPNTRETFVENTHVRGFVLFFILFFFDRK